MDTVPGDGTGHDEAAPLAGKHRDDLEALRWDLDTAYLIGHDDGAASSKRARAATRGFPQHLPHQAQHRPHPLRAWPGQALGFPPCPEGPRR